jgi:hypothetical protein
MEIKRTNFINSTSIFYVKKEIILQCFDENNKKLRFWYETLTGKLSVYGDFKKVKIL